VTLEDKTRHAEEQLFAAAGVYAETSVVQLRHTGVRLRVLSFGSGPPVVLLHGVASSVAAWTPLLAALGGYQINAVDLPGHGLSGPVTYRRRET
jgi:pimeloyl-ACP methyl ester carboxylesterase